MNANTPPPRLLTLPFAMLVCAHFVQGLAASSLLLLPLYLDLLGASRGLVGVLMTLANVGGLASRPFVGWALDRYGRKPILAVGTAMFATGLVLVGAVVDLGPAIWVARLLMGVGTGVIFTGYITLATDTIPESRRTEGIALFGVSGLLPMAFPPLITGAGIGAAELRWFYPWASLLVVGSLPFLAAIPETRREAGARPATPAEVMASLRLPALRPVWFATLLFGGLAAVFGAFAAVVAEHRHLDDPALTWFAYAATAVTVRIFGNKLPDRVGPSRLLGPAIGAYALGIGFAAVSHGSLGFALAGAFAGLGHGYTFPILAGQVATRSPAAQRGSSMAGFTALWDLAAIVCVPLAGVLADATNDGTMLLALVAGSAVALGAWRILERPYATSPR